MATFLVLQHIACEPPAAFEDELLACSDAYPQQAFAVHNAYAMQFHLEIDTALATTWGDVPAYAQSLDQLLGPGALPRLIAQVHEHQAQTTEQAGGCSPPGSSTSWAWSPQRPRRPLTARGRPRPRRRRRTRADAARSGRAV